MEFKELLNIVGDLPVFETGLLLAGDVDPDNVRRQLSRWTRAGWIFQLRRGVYALAPPYQKTKPHPFVVANALVRSSYVSLQSALAHDGMIPEYTPVVTSVTTARPGSWETPLGDYVFQHIKRGWFHGYQRLDLGGGQQAFVAWPEKALLDLVYLRPGAGEPEYLAELRLQDLERLNLDRLARLAKESGKPKLHRAAREIAALARETAGEMETL